MGNNLFLDLILSYSAEVAMLSAIWVFADYAVRGIISVATGHGLKIGGNYGI